MPCCVMRRQLCVAGRGRDRTLPSPLHLAIVQSCFSCWSQWLHSCCKCRGALAVTALSVLSCGERAAAALPLTWCETDATCRARARLLYCCDAARCATLRGYALRRLAGCRSCCLGGDVSMLAVLAVPACIASVRGAQLHCCDDVVVACGVALHPTLCRSPAVVVESNSPALRCAHWLLPVGSVWTPAPRALATSVCTYILHMSCDYEGVSPCFRRFGGGACAATVLRAKCQRGGCGVVVCVCAGGGTEFQASLGWRWRCRQDDLCEAPHVWRVREEVRRDSGCRGT